MNNGIIYIIGHGGAGFISLDNKLPINSFKSVTKAIEKQNADGVEVDVQLSGDNKLMLYHDDLLETSTYCSGCISAISAEELGECHYKSYGTLNFSKEKLITLDVIMSRFSKRKVKPLVFLDTKTIQICNENNYSESETNMIEKIDFIIKEYNAQTWLHVMSSSYEFLQEMQQLNPEVKLWLDGDFETNIPIAKTHNFYGVSGNNSKVSAEQISFAHDNGIYALLFGFKSQNGIVSAIKKNPDYLQTDNIILTQQILLQ
ncbi:MAG: hypothetical protein JKY30_09925 [Flavobacteriales bacterium]|nr:hypothetical protein [Flavobacteriales bacterium]